MDLKPLQCLNSAEQTELLNVVDELRAKGLSDFTSLPQLIVCGDQSSGKSSVLQAISGLVFPSKDNLCTRFATEVILRRASTKGLSVSIMPGQDRSEVDRERLLDFRFAIQNDEDFAALFDKAKQIMGLTDHSSAFSKDILRVEILGPNQPQLTLVDLPGLIHSESKSLTTQDVELVTELVKSYMQNPRSIILAVVTAKNDFSNQIILKRARELDPEGSRTLGIITKPDTLVKGSVGETSFLSLARNEEFEFKHGWHVVKNQDTAKGEFDPANRDMEENEWFLDSNFKILPSVSRGVSRLRERLSKMLFNQIREQLPGLMADISKESADCRAKLEELGQSRLTIEEQREYLLEISEGFEKLCTEATNGPYNDPFFGDGVSAEGYETRLRAVVRNMQIEFADIIRTEGKQWKILDFSSKDDRYRTRAQAIDKILILVKRSRCRELPGLPNPMLVAEVFREYSKPWEELAREHISKVWQATRVLLERVVEHLTEPDLGDLLFRFVLDPLMDEFLRNAQTKLVELNAVRDKAPVTTNHYFRDTVTKMRRDRDIARMEPKLKHLIDQHLSNQGGLKTLHIPDIILTAYPEVKPDMDTAAAEDVFDYMSAFYKVRKAPYPIYILLIPLFNRSP